MASASLARPANTDESLAPKGWQFGLTFLCHRTQVPDAMKVELCTASQITFSQRRPCALQERPFSLKAAGCEPPPRSGSTSSGRPQSPRRSPWRRHLPAPSTAAGEREGGAKGKWYLEGKLVDWGIVTGLKTRLQRGIEHSAPARLASSRSWRRSRKLRSQPLPRSSSDEPAPGSWILILLPSRRSSSKLGRPPSSQQPGGAGLRHAQTVSSPSNAHVWK